MRDLHSRITGGVLREVRKRHELTLRDVSERSGGAFRPTALAAWERGERHVSLERFCQLAELYQVPADRLLAEVVRRREERPSVIVDVAAVERLQGSAAQAVQSLVHQVFALRDDRASSVRLRTADLQVLSTTLGLREDELKASIRDALRNGVP